MFNNFSSQFFGQMWIFKNAKIFIIKNEMYNNWKVMYVHETVENEDDILTSVCCSSSFKINFLKWNGSMYNVYVHVQCTCS